MTARVLWLIERDGNEVGDDEMRGVVVAALDETAARIVALNEYGDEGPEVWRDEARTTIKRIGTADESCAGVVLSDYQAG